MQAYSFVSVSGLLLVTSIASAQTTPPAQSQWAGCKTSFLACATQFAAADYAKVNPAYRDEIKKGADFNMCKADSLNLQNEYMEWFRSNADKLRELDTAIDQGIRTANERLKSVRNFEANPVPGQTSKVPLKLSDIIEHLKLYRARLSNVPKSQVADLQKMAEQPGFSPIGVAHSQVIVAMEGLTTNLNASLKQSGATYSLVFEKGAVFSNLALKMDLEVDGKKLSFEFPILDESFERVNLSEQEKWNLIRKNKVQLDGYPVDARERFEAMQQKLRLASCKADWAKVVRSADSKPYVTPAEMGAAVTTTSSSKQDTWQEMPSANFNIDSIAVDGSGQVSLAAGYFVHQLEGNTWVKQDNLNATLLYSSADGAVYRAYNSDLFAVNSSGSVFRANNTIRGVHLTEDGLVYYTDGSSLYVSRPGFPDAKSIGSMPCYVGFSVGPKNSFYCTTGRHVYQIDAITGDSKQLKGAPEAVDIASTADGTLYALDNKGTIHKLTGSGWQVVLSSPDPRFPLLKMAINHSYLCASQFDGRIYCVTTP